MRPTTDPARGACPGATAEQAAARRLDGDVVVVCRSGNRSRARLRADLPSTDG